MQSPRLPTHALRRHRTAFGRRTKPLEDRNKYTLNRRICALWLKRLTSSIMDSIKGRRPISPRWRMSRTLLCALRSHRLCRHDRFFAVSMSQHRPLIQSGHFARQVLTVASTGYFKMPRSSKFSLVGRLRSPRTFGRAFVSSPSSESAVSRLGQS
jgi:hypothetical protein